MKIAVISPNKILLTELGKLLQAASHVPVLSEGGTGQLRQPVSRLGILKVR